MSRTIPDSCCQMEIPFEYLDVHNQPTPTDLEQNISKELVEVFLKTCTPIERALFGRDKALKGPGNLWINPDDRLGDNKVRLTPLKTEGIQALTHVGILEIGKRLEEKFEEENQRLMTKTVAEALGTAKLEADQRIKFRVEVEAEKLNDEWEKQVDLMNMQHENEKRNLSELNDGVHDLLRETFAKECEEEKNILREETIIETRAMIEANCAINCAERLDAELMQQSIDFEEKMRNTLNNLEANDREKMEALKDQCLDAMNLQQNLITCRQITETMHMAVTSEKHWRMRVMEMKNELAKLRDGTENHQSQSLKQLWIEFQHQLDALNGEQLRGVEKEIFDRIHQIRGELMIEPGDGLKGCFIIQEPIADIDESVTEVLLKNDESVDWIEKRENDSCLQIKREPYVDVQWEKNDIGAQTVPTVDSFTSTVFHRFLQPQRSLQPTEIASSIIKMVKESRDDQLLKENIAALIQDVLERFADDKCAPDANVVVPMPKTEAISIRDSKEVMSKRAPLNDEPHEPHENSILLSVVDSLEWMSQKTSHGDSSKTSTLPFEGRCVNASDKPSSAFPSYFRSQKKSSCKVYERMTDDDWLKLERTQQMGIEEKTSRQSSVRFDELHSTAHSTHSNKSSILKTSESKPEIDDALRPIHQKCRDVLGNMKLESLLNMICDDSSIKFSISK